MTTTPTVFQLTHASRTLSGKPVVFIVEFQDMGGHIRARTIGTQVPVTVSFPEIESPIMIRSNPQILSREWGRKVWTRMIETGWKRIPFPG